MASLSQRRSQIFRGTRIALGDNFRTDMHISDMEAAITRRGGQVTREVDKDTTILITSDKDYMRKSDKVKAALVKGGKAVAIVEWQWLIDCIDRNHKRPVKLYRLEQNKKQRKEDEEEAQAEAAIYAEKMEREGLFINWELNDIYTDATGFKFKVRLTRPRAENGEMDEDEHSLVAAASGRTDDRPRDNEHEIMTLYLAESKEKNPTLYTFAFEYQKRKGGKKYKNRPTFAGGVFADEFARFKDFFERKCGISWDERLAKVGVMRHLNFFEYDPPAKEGVPLGLIENDDNIPEAYKEAVMAQREAAEAQAIQNEIAELFGE